MNHNHTGTIKQQTISHAALNTIIQAQTNSKLSCDNDHNDTYTTEQTANYLMQLSSQPQSNKQQATACCTNHNQTNSKLPHDALIIITQAQTNSKNYLMPKTIPLELILTENPLVVDVLDDEPGASGEHTDEDVQVKEEGHPSSRLVFGDRSDDGDVNLGVTRVPQGIEASTPRCNVTCIIGTHRDESGLRQK